MKKVTFIILLVAFISSTLCGAADYVVIINSNNSLSDISRGDLKNIYLGKKTSWDGGQKIDVAVLGGGKAHESFCNSVINRSPGQFSTFWKTALFTGTGTPPKTVSGDSEMISFVKSNPAAIGYISSNAAPGGVKIISAP